MILILFYNHTLFLWFYNFDTFVFNFHFFLLIINVDSATFDISRLTILFFQWYKTYHVVNFVVDENGSQDERKERKVKQG